MRVDRLSLAILVALVATAWGALLAVALLAPEGFFSYQTLPAFKRETRAMFEVSVSAMQQFVLGELAIILILVGLALLKYISKG